MAVRLPGLLRFRNSIPRCLGHARLSRLHVRCVDLNPRFSVGSCPPSGVSRRDIRSALWRLSMLAPGLSPSTHAFTACRPIGYVDNWELVSRCLGDENKSDNFDVLPWLHEDAAHPKSAVASGAATLYFLTLNMNMVIVADLAATNSTALDCLAHGMIRRLCVCVCISMSTHLPLPILAPPVLPKSERSLGCLLSSSPARSSTYCLAALPTMRMREAKSRLRARSLAEHRKKQLS